MVAIKRHSAPLNRTSGRGNTRKYITIHETANRGRGADANAHARLQAAGNSRQASWHYQVDDKVIIQSYDDDVRCWHAGTTANNQSIAIEICVNSDGNYQKALDNAAALVAHLRKKHGIPWNRVVSHNFWTGKNCPTIMLSRKGQWDKFIKATDPKGATKVSTSSGSSSSSSSSSSTIGQARTNRDKVPVHSHRDSSGDRQIDTLHKKGYRVNIVENPKGGWTRIRNSKGPGGNGWVATAHLDIGRTPKGKSTTGSGSAYPNKALPLTDSHTTASHNAWVYLMRHAVNRTDRNLTINIQRWLRDLNYYKGAVDGSFGPVTVRALQSFLVSKGLLPNAAYVDGNRGPKTIRAEIQYLNDQRQYLI